MRASDLAQTQVVDCVSLTDLLGLVLPRHVREEQSLARTFSEAQADRIAEWLLGAAVRDVVGDVTERRIPVVRADATVVELAETMSRRRCALVMVEQRETGVLGVVTAGRPLEVLVDAAVGETPR